MERHRTSRVCERVQNPLTTPELFLVICIAYYSENYSGILGTGLAEIDYSSYLHVYTQLL